MESYVHDAPSSESRRMAVISHLGGLAPLVGVPGFVVPLVIWLMERGKDRNAEQHALEALNFQISMGIYTFGLITLIVVLSAIVIGLLFIPVLVLLWLARFVLCVVAAVRANDGGFYRYPLTFRLV